MLGYTGYPKFVALALHIMNRHYKWDGDKTTDFYLKVNPKDELNGSLISYHKLITYELFLALSLKW